MIWKGPQDLKLNDLVQKRILCESNIFSCFWPKFFPDIDQITN